jgi:hypothetical protein
MGYDTGKSKRQKFHWPSEAEQLVKAQGHQFHSSGRASNREQVISKLIQMSGNPRAACLRFMRRLGLAPQRSYREWTTGERQRLVELIEKVPIGEAARTLRRSPPSIRSMMHRLGLGARKIRDWFTVSVLAEVLGISRSEVQKWIDRGLLPCRKVQVDGVTRKIIYAEDFCLFVKNHGLSVIGNRLSSEALAFVRDYVFPRAHADLLSVRGPYEKGKKPAEIYETALADRDECDGNVTSA